MIYSCPPSTPLLALRTQAGMMDCERRIWVEKVCMVARVLHTQQEEENLCREVLQVQMAMGWPGLIEEVQVICKTVGFADVTKKYLNRQEVKEYIEYYDMKLAKNDMAPLEKCTAIRNRDFRSVQPYMYEKSLELSRLEFLWETRMIDTRTNMKGKYDKDKYSCPHCRQGREHGVLESSDNFLSECAAYADLRAGMNVEAVLEDRASFLRKAIKRRKELEARLKTTVG